MSVYAQKNGSGLPHWSVDAGLYGGTLTQQLTAIDLRAAYPAIVNSAISAPDAKGKSNIAGSLQLGYFFGQGRHLGISTGLKYQQQKSEITIAGYHAEYRSLDSKKDTFRQVITANGPLKERVATSGISIPLMLKYQIQFSRRCGLMADAGVLINVTNTSTYNADASFDYEAVYKFSKVDDVHTAIYDNGMVPGATTWLITRGAYQNDMQKFYDLQAQGYNIGLGVKPVANTGSVSYKTGSVGFMLQPAISYRLSEMLFLKVGVYYSQQVYSNEASIFYKTTDKAGSYSSILNGVTKSDNSSFGGNIGVRWFLGKVKDADHDGIPDKRDLCPDIAGLPQFEGCPDRDGDSIVDADDHCPDVPGLKELHGCPDADGDGITDAKDACPQKYGPDATNGCPDADGDGVADKDDACPSKKGPASAAGCPDTDGDGLSDHKDNCPEVFGTVANNGCPEPPKETPKEEVTPTIDISAPVLFGVGRATINKNAYPQLDEAARICKATAGAYIQLDGYTDNTGSAKYNRTLSRRRAAAVKRYFVKKGVDATQIKVNGHGSKEPETTNKTKEGRAQNRRVMIRLVANK
jgi:outer membrane protein OmpA-like peptidoglycan-associated protein